MRGILSIAFLRRISALRRPGRGGGPQRLRRRRRRRRDRRRTATSRPGRFRAPSDQGPGGALPAPGDLRRDRGRDRPGRADRLCALARRADGAAADPAPAGRAVLHRSVHAQAVRHLAGPVELLAPGGDGARPAAPAPHVRALRDLRHLGRGHERHHLSARRRLVHGHARRRLARQLPPAARGRGAASDDGPLSLASRQPQGRRRRAAACPTRTSRAR